MKKKHFPGLTRLAEEVRSIYDSMSLKDVTRVMGNVPWLICGEDGKMYLHVAKLEGTFIVHGDGIKEFIKDTWHETAI